MKRLLLVLSIVIVASVSASADTVFLSGSQLGNFAFDDPNSSQPGNNPNVTNQSLPNLGRYTIAWDNTNTGAVVGSISQGGLSLGTAGDTLQLTILNSNENPWTFQVFTNAGNSAAVSIVDGTSNTFSILLSGTVTSIRISVSANLPINGPEGPDRTAEFQLPGAIPEPSTMLLLGTGLIGAAGAIRRRFKGPNVG